MYKASYAFKFVPLLYTRFLSEGTKCSRLLSYYATPISSAQFSYLHFAFFLRTELRRFSTETFKLVQQSYSPQDLKMLRDVECNCKVFFPVTSLNKGGFVRKSQIASRLLYQLSKVKATEECGYFLAVTGLSAVGRGCEDESSSLVHFPVTFWCRTFLPRRGEVMFGTVCHINELGVTLKCGPMSVIYLSRLKMPNYSFVDGVNPFFLSNDLSRVEKDCIIRFMVLAVRWRDGVRGRQFHILATIDDASLGPVQLAGSEGMDL